MTYQIKRSKLETQFQDSYLKQLPNELIFSICKWLDYRSICRLECTSKFPYQIDFNKLWAEIFKRDFDATITSNNTNEFKKIYCLHTLTNSNQSNIIEEGVLQVINWNSKLLVTRQNSIDFNLLIKEEKESSDIFLQEINKAADHFYRIGATAYLYWKNYHYVGNSSGEIKTFTNAYYPVRYFANSCHCYSSKQIINFVGSENYLTVLYSDQIDIIDSQFNLVLKTHSPQVAYLSHNDQYIFYKTLEDTKSYLTKLNIRDLSCERILPKCIPMTLAMGKNRFVLTDSTSKTLYFYDLNNLIDICELPLLYNEEGSITSLSYMGNIIYYTREDKTLRTINIPPHTFEYLKL